MDFPYRNRGLNVTYIIYKTELREMVVNIFFVKVTAQMEHYLNVKKGETKRSVTFEL